MALPSIIYRVNLHISDVDRGVYDSLQATVARHPSETEERLVARLLAYALLFDPGLAFTKGVGAGDEPDLWLKGPDDRVLLWVEVGLPEADRLIKAGRHAARVAAIVCGKALPVWEQQHLPKLSGMKNLLLLRFDQSFVNNLTAGLDRSITWSITITDGTMYVTTGNDTFETAVQILSGNR